jgi:hypothetical protein
MTGILIPKPDIIIFRPTKVSTKASPILRNLKYSIIPEIAKQSDLKPRISKIFQL